MTTIVDKDPNPDNWMNINIKIHLSDYVRLKKEYDVMGKELGDGNKDYSFEQYLRETLMGDVMDECSIDDSYNHQEIIIDVLKRNPGKTPLELFDLVNNEIKEMLELK